MTPRWRHVAAVLVLVLVALVGGAAPAYAHAGGLAPQNYRSVVTGIVPRLTGVTAVMINNGTQLELRNDTRADLTVLTDPVRVVPPGGVLRYREERAVTPPAGRQWAVQVRSAGVEATVVGRLEWHDGPALAPWLLITAMFAVAGWLLGRSRWWLVGLAGGVVIVAGANIAHVGGAVAVVRGQSLIPLVIGASGVGLVCWPLSLVAVVTAIRRVPTTAFVAAVVGATLVVAGIADVDAFRYSQVPFAGPADLDRLLVAITLGGGAGLAAGGFAAVRRIAFSLREAVDASPADDFSSNAPFPDVAPSNGPSPDVALSDGPSPDVALSDGPSPDVALSDGPSPDVALSDGPSPDRPPPDSSLSEAGLFTGFPSDADPSSGFSSHASSSGVSAPDAYSDGITR